MKTALYALVALMASMSFGALATAQVPPRPVPVSDGAVSRDVDVQVMIVHAHNSNTRVDSRLEGLLQHLRHMRYTGYTVLDTKSESLTDGNEANYDVQGDRQLKVELVDHDGRNARLRIRMLTNGRKVLDTTVSVRRNRSFIVMGPQHDQGVLVFAITANY